MAVLGLSLPMLLVLAGLALMIAEALSPGAHLIVLGMALLTAGLFGAFVAPLASPIALAGMTLAFGALSLFIYREYDFYGASGGRTSDSGSLRGKTGRVVDRVTETQGRVKLKSGGFNPHYEARSVEGEIDVDEEIIVVDPGGGNVVTVAALDAIDDDNIGRALARDAAEAEDPDDAETDGRVQEAAAGSADAPGSPDGETDDPEQAEE